MVQRFVRLLCSSSFYILSLPSARAGIKVDLLILVASGRAKGWKFQEKRWEENLNSRKGLLTELLSPSAF